MAGITSYRDLALAQENGQTVVGHFRKVPSNATTAGWYFDLSMASGNPQPNYYASTPLESNALNGMAGLWRGSDVAPSEKILTEMMLCTSGTGFVGAFSLLDYLLFYPFIDMDDTNQQTMVEVDSLARYSDGEGVQVMAVALTPTVGLGTFTFEYVNQDGVSRTSPVQTCSTVAANIGSIVTSAPGTVAGLGPFLTLREGDTGVRRIVSFTEIVPNGGLCALVLVKPLATHAIREINTPTERSFVGPHTAGVRIYDGAYLNFIVQTATSVAGQTLTGRLNFAWN